jgi:hypothetical protein
LLAVQSARGKNNVNELRVSSLDLLTPGIHNELIDEINDFDRSTIIAQAKSYKL